MHAQVFCPAPGCGLGSDAEAAFSELEIASHCETPMVFRVFLAAQKRLAEASIVSELDQVYQQRLDAERRFDATEICAYFLGCFKTLVARFINVAIICMSSPGVLPI